MSKFIIRVYALFINSDNQVLLTDEYQINMKMTKFPGGGLEFGEGTIDCLRREIREEMNQEIEDIRHFYTTDFYQPTQFHDNAQIISIYYIAKLIEPFNFKVSEKAFDFDEMKNGNQSFRWVDVKDIRESELTFPIDKVVLKKLQAQLI